MEELVPQLRDANVTLIIAQPDIFSTVYDACSQIGLDYKRIVLMDFSQKLPASPNDLHSYLPPTVQEIVEFGTQSSFTEFRLEPREGRTKIAILFPSSGTTGAPKLIALSHYAFIANIVQAVAHDNSGKGPRRYNPGEVSGAGTISYVEFGKHLIHYCIVLPFFR